MKKLPKKTEKVLRDVAKEKRPFEIENECHHKTEHEWGHCEIPHSKMILCPPHEHKTDFGCVGCDQIFLNGKNWGLNIAPKEIRWETAPPIIRYVDKPRPMWPIYVAWSLSTILAYWIGWAVAFGPNWAGAVRP